MKKQDDANKSTIVDNKFSLTDRFNLNINVNKDDSDLNDYLFIAHEFGMRPSKVIFYSQFDAKGVWEIISEDFKVVDFDINKTAEIIPDGDNFIYNNKYSVKLADALYLSFIELDSTTTDGKEERIITNFTLFYKQTEFTIEALNAIVNKFDGSIMSFSDILSKSKNFYIKLGPGGYELAPFISTKIDSDEIELYYNDDITKKASKLIKQINKSNKGLSILWGERGNGKTSLANWITSQLERQVLYIPSVIVDQTINSADFLTFLERNNNSVLLIDDCDYSLNHFKNDLFTSNIKQLVDGMLSDHLNLQIIVVSNTDDSDLIEDDYLDCNSLIMDIEFDELKSKKATELSKHLGKNKVYKTSNKVSNVVKGITESDNQSNIGY